MLLLLCFLLSVLSSEMIVHPHRETQRNFLMTIQVIGIRQMTYFVKTCIHGVESNAQVPETMQKAIECYAGRHDRPPPVEGPSRDEMLKILLKN